MQVSSMCAGSFSSFELTEFSKVNTAISSTCDNQLNTFTSIPKCDTAKVDMNNIFEWKTFCQKQIMANNLDYIA